LNADLGVQFTRRVRTDQVGGTLFAGLRHLAGFAADFESVDHHRTSRYGRF